MASLSHLKSHFIDYPVYEQAGLRVLMGDYARLYDLNRTSPGGYYYSVFFAFAFAPLSALGIAGKILFFALLVASYVFSLFFSLKHFSRLEPARASLLILLTAYAANDAFMNANIGVLLLALSLLTYHLSDQRPALAGLILAVAIAFKIYPAFLLGFFVWKRNFRLVGACIATTVFLYLGIPLFLAGDKAGWQLIQDQFAVVKNFGNHWPYDSLVFQNIPAAAMRIAKPLFFPAIVISLIGLIIFYGKSVLSRERSNEFVLKMFALALAFVPLLCPVSWYNMALFYAPILAFEIERALNSERHHQVALGIYGMLFCLTTPDIIGRDPNDVLESYSVPFWGIAVVVFTFTRELIRGYPQYFYLRWRR